MRLTVLVPNDPPLVAFYEEAGVAVLPVAPGGWDAALATLRGLTDAVMALDAAPRLDAALLRDVVAALEDGARFVGLLHRDAFDTPGAWTSCRAVHKDWLDALDWTLWGPERRDADALERLAPLLADPARFAEQRFLATLPALLRGDGDAGAPLDRVEAERRLTLATDPLNPVALSELAELRALRGDAEEAEHLRLKAAVMTGAPRHLSALAQSALDLGHVDEAAAYIARAVGRRAPAIHGGQRRPVVGVGLPVYSGGDLLAGAIEAILGQTFGDLELVVYDVGADPQTRALCEAANDPRLRHMVTGERLGHLGLQNIVRSMEATQTPYFMWGSYDDRHHPTFLAEALRAHEADPDVALVYGRARVEDAAGRDLGIARDAVDCAMDDPAERFRHMVWELNLCNAWYGLFRREALRRTRALHTPCYRAHDNLLLAEITLYGKVVQLDEVLFTRRLTRPRDLSFEQAQADVVRAWDPVYLREGPTLPIVRLAAAHCELVTWSHLPRVRRAWLVGETVRAFRARMGTRMEAEIQRAVELVLRGEWERRWDAEPIQPAPPGGDAVESLHMGLLRQRLQEAAFLFPERADIERAERTCREHFGRWRVPE